MTYLGGMNTPHLRGKRGRSLSLLLLLHKGVHETPPWQTFVNQARQTFGLSYVSIITGRSRGKQSTFQEFFSSDHEHLELRARYKEELFRIDPIPYHSMKPDCVYKLSSMLGVSDLTESVFYRDFLLPMGISDLIISRVVEPRGNSAWLTLACGVGQISLQTIGAASDLLPHLSVALHSFVLRDQLEVDHVLFSNVTEQIDLSAVILSPYLRVIEGGRQALEILADMKAIWIGPNRELHFASSVLASQFSIAAAAIVENGGEWLSQVDGDPIIQVLLTRPSELLSGPRKHDRTLHMYLHRVSQRLRGGPLFQKRLMMLFGMTGLEAAIADELCCGALPTEIAIHLHLTEHTVRSYLKSIFSKMGARRQADVIRIIWSSIVSLV
jgi:DNA-binding CsgD family transcriptional regulator